MKIKLRKRKLKSGNTSLLIEYFKGSITLPNGKRKYDREYENLELYLTQPPKTPAEKKKNKETLALAKKILSIRRAEFYQGKFKLKNTTKEKKRFLEYFEEIAEEKLETGKSDKNYGNWSAALVHLRRCISETLTFKEVDEQFVKDVRKYFNEKAKTKSNVPISQNTKYSYFNKFKAALRMAFNEGYLSINLGAKVKSFKQPETKREYLTHSELNTLAHTYCKYEVLKRAFLFSALTGLRWSDINKMRWAEVRDEDKGTRIVFTQQKTDGLEYHYISKQARDLMDDRRGPDELVFEGLKYSMTYNNEIVRWCNRAGITKHITFHSARHTNAVLLLENGADIYTVSKLLGHRELRTTQIYARIIDEKKKEATKLFPEIKFKR